MADNVNINPGTTGTLVPIRTDEVGGVQVPVSKVLLGADGVDGGFVATGNPLPVGDAGGSLSVDDGGGSLTVDGTVAVTDGGGSLTVDVAELPLPTGAATAANQATANTSLATLAAAANISTSALRDAIQGAGTGTLEALRLLLVTLVGHVDGAETLLAAIDTRLAGTLAVSATALPLPTGAATAAAQTTANTALQAIQAAVEALDNAVGGSELQVDVVGALPAGDNNIGNVDVVTLPTLPAGTNNIGDVDVLTLPSLPAGTNNIGDVDIVSQPALTRTNDAVAAALQTDALMNGLTALTPKFAAIGVATSGDNTLVAAVTSKKIRVLSLMLLSAGSVNVYLADGAGTVLFGGSTNKINLVAQAGFVLPASPFGWFETAAGQLLKINLSAAVAVSGGLTYVEV